MLKAIVSSCGNIHCLLSHHVFSDFVLQKSIASTNARLLFPCCGKTNIEYGGLQCWQIGLLTLCNMPLHGRTNHATGSSIHFAIPYCFCVKFERFERSCLQSAQLPYLVKHATSCRMGTSSSDIKPNVGLLLGAKAHSMIPHSVDFFPQNDIH